MLVDSLPDGHVLEPQQRDALEILLAQPRENEVRPCLSCLEPCSCSGSTTCACDCTPNCTYAQHVLPDPSNPFHVDSDMAPLVYALSAVRLTMPCWSNRGLMDADTGEIESPPQVWFTSTASLYPSLIASYLDKLYQREDIQHQWGVRVLEAVRGEQDRFSVEPLDALEPETDLDTLYRESRVIAEGMAEALRDKAVMYLALPLD